MPVSPICIQYVLSSMMKIRSGYLPSLDGWRCLAILGVIMAHDKRWHLLGKSNEHVRGYGGYGVQLFFALSGILICWRILEEESLRGTFRLRDFYVRRFFRIQPAAWLYLGTPAVLMTLGLIHERWHFWFGALFLYQNFTWHSAQFDRMLREGWFTGHFWTLAVEEHFYILLSLFLFLCKRNRVQLLASALALLLLAQTALKGSGYYSSDVSARRTYWCIQYLLAASLLAMLLRIPRIRTLADAYLRPWVVFSITLAIGFIHQTIAFGPRSFFYVTAIGSNQELLFYSFPFWVAASMLHPKSWTTVFLEWTPLRFLGRLSYSIYLWHLLFFSVGETWPHITWRPLVVVGQQPWRYLATLCVAMLSYFVIEKPMIRLGHRIATPATPGHRDLAATEPALGPPAIHQFDS